MKSKMGTAAQEAKCRAMLAEFLREIQKMRKQTRTHRAEMNRLRASSRRKMADTWRILRRIEANLRPSTEPRS